MSICRGATAMGYFTHVWKPAYSQFGVPEANRRALRQINDQITQLTPAILGQPRNSLAAIDSTNTVKLDLMARESNGELYLFAVNYDEQMKNTTATIKVRGLASTTPVLVVDEGRRIAASDGNFSDTFGPLAVHIYKISPPFKLDHNEVEKY